MKKLRTAVAALVIAAGAFGAYAFTNSNANTNEVQTPQTYWVVQQLGTNYQVSATPPSPENDRCDFGDEHPCQISTTASVTSGQISMADANNPALTNVLSRQPEF